MNKTKAKKMLRGDYMDSLSAFAGYVVETAEATGDDMESVVNDLDDIVWEVASDLGPAKEEKWLRIYTALLCGC